MLYYPQSCRFIFLLYVQTIVASSLRYKINDSKKKTYFFIFIYLTQFKLKNYKLFYIIINKFINFS